MRARDFSTEPRSSRSALILTLAGGLALAVAVHQAFTARLELGRTEARVAEARRDLGALRDRKSEAKRS